MTEGPTDSSSDARKPLPLGVRRVRGRNGKQYLYLETDGGRIRLAGEPGTREFDHALDAARRRRPQQLGPERFDRLIRDFLASPEHLKRTAPTTQALRAIALEKIRARFDRFAIKDFNRREIRRDIYSFRNDLAATPRMADVCIDTLSRLLNWAYDQGAEIEVNHAARVEHLVQGKTRAEIIWTDAERATFVAEAKTAVARAFLALFYSGARLGDAAAWRWDQYDGQWLVFTPAKTLRKTALEVHLPVYALPPFQAFLDGLPRDSETILITTTGRPWVRTYLSERFITERRRIFGDELDRHAHDLRGTVTTKLIDAGCTDREVSAITGHVTAEASIDRARSLSAYVKRTRQQAINAYQKWYLADFAPKGELVQFPGRKTPA